MPRLFMDPDLPYIPLVINRFGENVITTFVNLESNPWQ